MNKLKKALTVSITLFGFLTYTVAFGAEETNPYMGAPVTLVKAPNGAIANKKK